MGGGVGGGGGGVRSRGGVALGRRGRGTLRILCICFLGWKI